MKGEFWIRHLSQEEKTNFLNNLTSFRGDASRNFLESEYNVFHNFIAGAFVWDDSHEGFDYWFRISRRDVVKYKLNKFIFV